MSLQLVAQHLAQKGRGPDSTLVHMSNREVAGLNALAQKHGGHLSTNPSTGLPEAGFLDSILPAVAGAGLTYFSGGAISPLMSAGIVGGLTGLDSKDLSKGLMAGLGAWGGGEMVGGLAGLGATSTGAGEAARQAAVNGAIENGTYQSAVGSGLNEFAAQPMASLSTLGGGSALKGSLPILAGLAPAAADALDNSGEDNGAPAQKKGYIRKYALDPVTGQYKQVGVYEAGGDPNKDVTTEAGTAGAFGGVGQSEYQKAHGMADGGTTSSDSSRIYDYLMGRGKNPMQFRHTTAPQVDYNIPKPPEPITPTTPILEKVYDQYGNRSGGGMDAEQRAEQEKAYNTPQDYLSIDRYDPDTGTTVKDVQSQASLAAMSPAERAMHMQDVRLQSPIRTAISDVITDVGVIPIGAKILDSIMNPFGKPVNLDPAPVRDVQPGEFRYNYSPTADAKSDIRQGGFETTPYGDAKSDLRGGGFDNTPAPGTGNYGDARGDLRGGGSDQDGGQMSGDPSGGDHSTAAHGGYLQHGQFQHMAYGGISGHLRPPQPFYANGKFSYKGPQVYADGGIAALAQGYDDGGMTLPMRAQPINNLGSMHPKSLQAAYDHAVATNDVAGARKYQNELGLREKFKNPQIYADGGETGEYNLGGYSDGGRLLKGPGDGVSDDIPATIGNGQPARLADGEFVVPARIVSELGNGSTDAGARELYKMMDRIQAGRAKTVGKDQVATNSKAVRHLPA